MTPNIDFLCVIRENAGKTAFETEVGVGFEWIEADKACRILTTYSGSIKKQDSWQDQFLWLMDMAQRIKKATIKLDK